MITLRKSGHVGAIGAALVAALAIAACGSSGGGRTNTGAAGSAATSTTSSAAPVSAKGAAVGTASGAAGTYLTGASGRALYLWVADSGGMSHCSGACAGAWPPLITHGTPIASHGVKAADLGTVRRADGSRQVTYNGHPLYYFAGDTSAGTTAGQGSDGFGARWWLVSPGGTAITSAGSAGGAGTGGASSSSGSGGWG